MNCGKKTIKLELGGINFTNMTLKNLLAELSLVEEKEIKRHAKGLLIAIEKSNRKELLDYGLIPKFDRRGEVVGHNCMQNAFCEICGLKI